MPGITGIIGRGSSAENTAALEIMTRAMKHEDFYVEGSYVNERLGVWIGWANLKNSFSDCLPIWNETRDVCLLFSGEDFRKASEIEGLRLKGHQHAGDNATYLVHLYEELGGKFFEVLNGLFCGVLIDFREQKVMLFNDRYGLNRIYFHQTEHCFYFASEAKSLLRILPATRNLDYLSFGEFISVGCVLQNRSLFAGISVLPPASMWSFHSARLTDKQTYFDPTAFEQQDRLGLEDYYQALKKAWVEILDDYFRGNQSCALSLTGGVDSRMILAWSGHSPGTLPCYTMGGIYRDSADVKISRETARLCQQEHSVIEFGKQFLANFPALAERAVYISDGTAEVRGACDLFAQQKARALAPVRVSGVYGGEILRHLVVFKPSPVHEALFAPEVLAKVRQASSTYHQERDCHPLTFTAFKQTAWHIFGPLCADRSQVSFRTPYLDNALVKVAYRAPIEATSNGDISLRLIAEGNHDLARLETDRGISWPPTPIVSRIRHLFQEFTFKAEYAYDYGMPQWLARLDRHLTSLHLERCFLGRHKFYHFRIWYRDHLADYLRDTLLDSKSPGRCYLQPKSVETLIQDHLEGKRNNTTAIHKLLTCELIQRMLIERN